jgi:hypothetical protein
MSDNRVELRLCETLLSGTRFDDSGVAVGYHCDPAFAGQRVTVGNSPSAPSPRISSGRNAGERNQASQLRTVAQVGFDMTIARRSRFESERECYRKEPE